MKVEGIWKAMTPVHQGGNEKTGSEVNLNRLSFFINGRQEEIPIISGNGIRGAYRRRLARDFLRLINKKRLDSKRVFYFLFAGGMNYEVVDQADAGSLNVELRERIRKYFPTVALLGGNLGNQPFEGALRCGIAKPVCQELVDAGMLPGDFLESMGVKAYPSFYQYIGQEFFTRKDDIRERGEDEAAMQMLVTHEVFVPGTVFYHKWVVESDDPVIVGCFWRGIKLFLQDPHVGGGKSKDMGEISIQYEGYDDGLDKPYLDFISENKDTILQMLAELEKQWK